MSRPPGDGRILRPVDDAILAEARHLDDPNIWLPAPPENADPDMLHAGIGGVLACIVDFRERAARYTVAAEAAAATSDELRHRQHHARALAYTNAASTLAEALVDAFQLWSEYTAAMSALDAGDDDGGEPVPVDAARRELAATYAAVIEAAGDAVTYATRMLPVQLSRFGAGVPAAVEEAGRAWAGRDLQAIGPAARALADAVTLTMKDLGLQEPGVLSLHFAGAVLTLRHRLEALDAAITNLKTIKET